MSPTRLSIQEFAMLGIERFENTEEISFGWRLSTIISTAVLSGIFLACFLGPIVFSFPQPTGGSALEAGLPPFSGQHALGTDLNGNDVLSRLLHGGRLSLLIAIAANLFGLFIGGIIGATSGYIGGHFDAIVMRLVDGFIAFPSIVLVLTIAQTLDRSYLGSTIALVFFTAPAFARVARSATLRIRDYSFIISAKLSNVSTIRILVLHVGSYILPQLLTFMFLGIGLTIVFEGAMSYLGLGVAPPAPSWGNMIYHGQQALTTSPMLVIIPSTFLFVTVLCCNLLGDALRMRWVR